MTEFEKIVIGKSSIPSLIITVLLMIAIPVGCFLSWRGKHKQQTKISYLIAGAIGFILSARVLELGVHYVCILADNPVSRFINGNTWAFVLYGITMAGVFEECGRHIILKYILKKNRTRENAVLYGIGHGGIEILAVLLPTMILYLVIAILFSQGDVEEAMKQLKITEETATSALPSVQAAALSAFCSLTLHVWLPLLSAKVPEARLFYGKTPGICCHWSSADKALMHGIFLFGRAMMLVLKWPSRIGSFIVGKQKDYCRSLCFWRNCRGVC